MKWLEKLTVAIVLALVLASTSGCVGLKPRVVVVPADRTVTFVKAGTTFTATNDAVLIGQALWLDLNEALATRLEVK